MAENNEFYRLNLVLRMEDRLSQSLRGVDRQVQTLERAFGRAQATASRLGNTNFKAVVHIDTTRIESALNGIVQRLDALNGKTAAPTIIINDQSTRTINNIDNHLRQTTSRKWDVVLGIKDGVTSKLSSMKETLMSPMGMLGMGMAGIGAGSLVSGAVGTYKEFEHQMKAVQAISGATGDDLERLTAKAREMGAATSFSATEAGKAFEYMAMAGWKTDQMMAGLPGILSLAAASGEDLGKTSDIVTDAMTAFHMVPEEAAHFSDVLAQTASNANTNVAMMGYTFQYLASTAGTLGYSIEDVSLAIGTVANAGIKGEKAGTGLLAMLNGMISPSDEAATMLDRLGLSITDASGEIKPFKTLLTDLRTSFAGLSKIEQAQAAAAIAGVDGMKAMQIIATTSQEDFEKLANSIDHASDSMEYNGVVYQGAAQKMAAVRIDSLEGDLQILNSAWEDFQIGLLSDGGGDFLRGFVQSATETIGEFGDILKDPEFQKLDWGDQIIYLLDRAMEKLDVWASGSGGEQFGKAMTKLAEIGIRAFIAALTGLVTGAMDALMNGNLLGAAGLGLGAAMLPGTGMLASGVAGAAKTIFYSSGEAAEGGGATGGWNWGRIGTAAKWAGRIAKPIQAIMDANRLYDSDDKVKTGSEIAGGWAGMLAGAKLGAATGGAIGAGFAGIGAAPGALVGGLLGGIGGYMGGEKLGGRIADSVRGWFSGIKEQAGEAVDELVATFSNAPDRIGAILDESVDTFSGFPERAAMSMGETAGYFVTALNNLPEGVAEKFNQLATEVDACISTLPGQVSAWGSETAIVAETYAAEAVNGTVNWFAQLPGMAGEKMSAMYNEVSNWASNIISGIQSLFAQIPGMVGGYFDRAIDAIQGKISSIKASFSLGFSAGAAEAGHAEGGIFNREHIARFAEGNKPEAVIPLDISKRSRGLALLEQVQSIFGLGDRAGNSADSFRRFIGRIAGGGGQVSGEGFSLQGEGMSVLAQAKEMLAQNAELLSNAGSGAGFTPAMAMATAGGSDFGGSANGGSPSFHFSGINFSFGSDIDEEELAISIGRRFLAEIRQGQENRG